MSERAQTIMKAAERRLRNTGYNGFSFRDLAEDVGVKSASVHHHFPTKEALVATMAADYAERFFAAVADPAPGAPRTSAYVHAFREAIADDGMMCLCGMLAAERRALPDSVAAESRRFFERALAHLAAGLDPDPVRAETRAAGLLARLEGALILARAFGDPAVFDRAVADIAAPAGA